MKPKRTDPTLNARVNCPENGPKVSVCGLPQKGVVHTVRGAVVDVTFAEADLPSINSKLVAEWDRPTALILEVHSHLNQRTVRAVAFQSTAGLSRGVLVHSSGGSVTVPVGEAVLGRLLDVVGDVQDEGPALPGDTPHINKPVAFLYLPRIVVTLGTFFPSTL